MKRNLTEGWFFGILPDMNTENPTVEQYLFAKQHSGGRKYRGWMATASTRFRTSAKVLPTGIQDYADSIPT